MVSEIFVFIPKIGYNSDVSEATGLKAKFTVTFNWKNNPNKIYIILVSLLCWVGLFYSVAHADAAVVIIAAVILAMIGFVVPFYQKSAASLFNVESENRFTRYILTALGTVLLEAGGLLLALAVWFPLGVGSFLLS